MTTEPTVEAPESILVAVYFADMTNSASLPGYVKLRQSLYSFWSTFQS